MTASGLNSRELEILQIEHSETALLLHFSARAAARFSWHSQRCAFLCRREWPRRTSACRRSIQQSSDAGRAHGFASRAIALKDQQLAGWADYYEQIQNEADREHALAAAR